jgi:hypothetical protein
MGDGFDEDTSPTPRNFDPLNRMRNPRLYVLFFCVVVAARASYRGALQNLNGDLSGWAGLITFWIPMMGILWIVGSHLAPAALRYLKKKS